MDSDLIIMPQTQQRPRKEILLTLARQAQEVLLTQRVARSIDQNLRHQRRSQG